MTNDTYFFFTVPLPTLIICVFGYIGYCIAYTGRNEHHGPLNTLFNTLCFGLIAWMTFDTLTQHFVPKFFAVTAALFSAIIASSAWRKWGSRWVINGLRWARVSFHDGHKTAWQSVIADDRILVSQITVYLKSGVTLMCDDTQQFEKTTVGQMHLGMDGSVALYVTDIKRPNETDWTALTKTLDKAGWGDEITYIPASEIERVSLRIIRR